MHNEVVSQFLRNGKNSQNLRFQKNCVATKIGITFESRVSLSLTMHGKLYSSNCYNPLSVSYTMQGIFGKKNQ